MTAAVAMVNDLASANAVLKPKRVQILRHLAEPRSCAEVGLAMGESAQAIYYHVKALEKAGAVRKVRERPARGFTEAIYQATALQFWLSPRLVRLAGGRRKARERIAMGYLITLAEDIADDVARLSRRVGEVPTLGLSAQVRLPDPETRAAFMADVQRAVQRIAARYGDRAPRGTGEPYTMNLAVYPTPRKDER